MKKILESILICLFLVTSTALANKSTLNVYSWGAYIPAKITRQFSKETGITVNLTEYDNNETMLARLKASKNLGYDIVIPSDHYVHRMIKHEMLHPLDKSKLSNLDNINKFFLDRSFDPKNRFSIPYIWGTTGIIINTKYIDKKKVSGWENFWDKKYKNKIMMLNDMRDVFAISLLSLGYSINDKNPEHIKEAYLKLKRLLPNIKVFNVDTVPNIYIDEDATIGMIWSGDYKLAKEANRDLQYIYPKERFLLWIDSLVILKNAPNIDNAHKFINFIMRPKVAVEISNNIGHTNTNKTAFKLTPQKNRLPFIDNPGEKILKRGEILIDLDTNTKRLYEKYWEKLKIGG